MPATRLHTDRLPAVDTYIANAAPFAQPILAHLREAVHQAAPGTVETIKWSRPFFTLDGVIFANISAFKHHCSFGLWGKQIGDTLTADGVAGQDGMGSMGKIVSLNGLPPRRKLIAYISTAATAVTTGQRTKAWERPRVAKPGLIVPSELAAALKSYSAAAVKAFAAMTPGCRREYCAWIDEARRIETRTSRATTAAEWIANGKSRNWKYETR